MAQQDDQQAAKKKGGGTDISLKQGIVANSLGNVIGIVAHELAQRQYIEGGALDVVLKGITNYVGPEVTYAGMIAVPSVLETLAPTALAAVGVPAGAAMMSEEVIDEWFDAIREIYTMKGTLSQGDIGKATQQVRKSLVTRLNTEMTFAYAMQFLSAEQQVELMQKVGEFKAASAENTSDWDGFWHLKLNKLGVIKPLLTIPVAQWRGHLESLFARPPQKAKKVAGLLSKLAPGGIISALLGGAEDPTAVTIRQKAAEAASNANRSRERAIRQRKAIRKTYYS